MVAPTRTPSLSLSPLLSRSLSGASDAQLPPPPPSSPSPPNHRKADGPYAVVLAPTRELAQQIEEEVLKLAHYTEFRRAASRQLLGSF